MLKTGTTMAILAAIALSIVTINTSTKAQSDETNIPERTTTQPERTTPTDETTTPESTTTQPEQTTPNPTSAQSEGDSNIGDTDRQFVTQAARDGIAEVQLGQLAAQRGSSDAVKQFGQRMVRDHTQANDRLRQIASEKGFSLPTDMGSQNQSVREKLSRLSGAEFDRQYMQHMVEDHTKGLALYQTQAEQGEDADLKAFAAQTVPVLQEHLQLARSISGNTTSPNR
ncbi:MAG TPA: DUF4142 domain-containing protein [Leptolyngbyaceae cyanobacterium]